jgi:alpha-L-rhamnosidase
MMNRRFALWLAVAAAAAAIAGISLSGQTSSITVQDLTCEYLVNPLGIDTEQPRLSWRLAPGPRGRTQSAYQILVASSPENLQKNIGDLWNSGKVNASQSVLVPYQGRPLNSRMRAWWKVRVWDENGRVSPWSAPARWSMGLLRPSDWQARWIGLPHPEGAKPGAPLPFPWLRKTVELKQKPARATAYVNAQGYYELYVNGKKVDDYVLVPAVSDFSKRNLYLTHDVTNYMVPGKNVIALWLGRGWYVRGHPGVIHDGPIVRAQVEMEMPGGESVSVVTDDTWKVKESMLTPLGRGTAFGDYGGERYDARLELPNWNLASLDDSGWKQAAVFGAPQVETAAQMVQPNRLLDPVKPVKVQEESPGVYLMQMEKNYTGWFQIRIPGDLPAGTMVRLEYGDTNPTKERFQTFNQRDEIITAGKELNFCSRFNYHAFSFVRITGLKRAPALTDVKAWLIHTGYDQAGEFESSNDLLNRIFRTVAWTYRCLTLGGYVVDCPHRERLGYGGDAGTSIETGMYTFDTAALYNKWTADWRAAQDPRTGDLPYTAPNYQDQGGGGPMWSGFCVTLPWHVYTQYGDKQVLETNYNMIQKWLEFAHSKTVDNILEFYVSFGIRMPQWNYLGDWVTPRRPGEPDISRDKVAATLINNLHYLYTLQLASNIATILNRPEDAAKYQARAEAVKSAIHRRFFDPKRQIYGTGQQPYLAFPLLVSVVPPEHRPAVMKNLERTILVDDKGHINAGMHGTYFLLKYLMEADRNDLIYEMVSKTTWPGWGYMLEQGATTIWEGWSGQSRIHDTLISVGSWFIQGIGGIRLDEKAPGFRRFIIKPAVVGDLKFARTRYKSIHGPIVSNWRIEGDTLHLDVSAPPNTTATVYVPAASSEAVTEGGRPAAKSPGVKAVGYENGRALFEIAPGQYSFATRLVKQQGR